METVGQQKWGISHIKIFGELKESIWVLGWVSSLSIWSRCPKQKGNFTLLQL